MTTKHLSPEIISERRLQAVRLRLNGHTVEQACHQTGLSAPTVSAAWKAFKEGGWQAVPLRPRGRKHGQTGQLDEAAQRLLVALLSALPPFPQPAWSSRMLAKALKDEGHSVSPRGIDHWLEAHDLKPPPLALEHFASKRGPMARWYRQQVQPLLEKTHKAQGAIWQGGVRVAGLNERVADAPGRFQLYLHGKRGALYTRCFTSPPVADDYLALFERLLAKPQRSALLIFHGAWFQASPSIQAWLVEAPEFHLLNVPPNGV